MGVGLSIGSGADVGTRLLLEIDLRLRRADVQLRRSAEAGPGVRGGMGVCWRWSGC